MVREKQINTLIKNIIFWPKTCPFSSQTGYEFIFGCLSLYKSTGDQEWLDKALYTAEKLIGNQTLDGGFDIGFNFLFGKGLLKKHGNDPTTPELLSAVALADIRKNAGNLDFDHNIDAAYKWALRYIYSIDDKKYAIPYAPLTLDTIHINNSNTFAAACIVFCNLNEDSANTQEYLEGLIRYIYDAIDKNPESKMCGSLKYFSQESSVNMLDPNKLKIDNCHIGHQLHYHCRIEKKAPNLYNRKIIEFFSNYLLSIADSNGVFEYCNSRKYAPRDVQIWGYASVIQGLVSAYEITNNKELLTLASKIKNFILKYSYNGEYFCPVLDVCGNVLESEYYPRTNAWVFHSLAFYYQHVDRDPELLNIISVLSRKLLEKSLKGSERNMWSYRKLYLLRLRNFLTFRSIDW
jgi:hypothetical protein